MTKSGGSGRKTDVFTPLERMGFLTGFTPSWDLYSCSIISLFIFIQFLSWGLFPFFIDIYYHLAAMLGYNAAGGYTAYGFWEYAPVGRPHLYPPLLHVMMLALFKAGLSKMFIARLFSFIMFPLAVTSIWLFMRYIAGKSAAFFAVLVASSVYSFYYMLMITIPASIAVLFALASFVCVDKGRAAAGALLLAYSFYAHALMPWIMSLAFVFYAVTERKKRAPYLGTVLTAVVLAAPVIVNQFCNRGYYRHIDIIQDHRIEMSILLVACAVVGAAISARKKGRYYFLLCMLFSFAVLIPMHRFRFVNAEGLFAFIPLAAVGLDFFYSRMHTSMKKAVFILAAFILFAFVSPSVYIEDSGASPRLFNSTLVNASSAVSGRDQGMGRSVFFKKYYNKIAAIVQRHSAKDEIIYSNFDYFAGIIGVLADRATSNAMLSEVRPYRNFDQVRASALMVWLKDPENIREEPIALVRKYGLRKIKDAEMAIIYRNDLCRDKRQVPAPLVPTRVIFILFFASICVVIYDILKGVRPSSALSN
jgi:hypothetical protein